MKLNEIEKSIHLAGSLEDKIALSVLYAQVITGGKDKIYDAIEIEKKLILDSSYLLSDLTIAGNESNRVIHVISEGYLGGGHTRLCERLSLMGHTPSDLLVTRQAEEATIQRLKKYFARVTSTYCKDIKENITSQIEFLSNYRKIILHIHPDDISLVLSLGLLKMIKKDIQIYFVNHADHLFSFGKSLPNVMFQISNRGYEIDSTIHNSNYHNSFLGIPVDSDARPIFSRSDNKFLMAGPSYKMKPNKNFSAPQLVNFILSKNKNYTFTIIGVRKVDYWWWFVKLKYQSRCILYKELNYTDYIDVVKKSDICVDTLPITGGTAFVEMYMLGLRPIGINTGISGYTPLDTIKVNSINNILFETPAALSHELYSEVQSVHSIKSVEGRYLDALDGCYHSIPESLKCTPNNMELFVRAKKHAISSATVKYLFSIRSLTLYQKVTLLLKHYKVHHFLLFISLKPLLLFIEKIRANLLSKSRF